MIQKSAEAGPGASKWSFLDKYFLDQRTGRRIASAVVEVARGRLVRAVVEVVAEVKIDEGGEVEVGIEDVAGMNFFRTSHFRSSSRDRRRGSRSRRRSGSRDRRRSRLASSPFSSIIFACFFYDLYIL